VSEAHGARGVAPLGPDGTVDEDTPGRDQKDRKRVERDMKTTNRTGMIIGGAVAVLVAVAAVLAIAMSGGGGEESGKGSVPFEAVVEITGEELPTQDGVSGKKAPGFAGVNYENEPVSFTPGADGPAILVFGAHWCPHCNTEIPKIASWARGNDLGKVRLILVSTAEQQMRENFPASGWVKGLEWPGEVLADDAESSLLRAYGLQGFPGIAVVQSDGTMVLRGTGSPENLEEQLSYLVANLNVER
jgi:cytochrome c biogenesis protein CcmG, thiol:disulfide interchange protein DsbE